MDVLNRKSLLLGMALCVSSAVFAQAPNTGAPSGPNVTPSAAAPKAVPYDCFGLAGVALRSCIDLNSAAANAGNNTPSGSHDCGGMTGAALATCRELNGEIVEPPMNSSNPGASGSYGTSGYVAPGMAPGYVPPASNANPAAATDSSSGSNPTSLSPGSGTTGLSGGSNPTGLSGGSGRSPSSSAPGPGNTTAGTNSNANSSGGGKSGM
jgi:hypothetical protein